ncbi:hypothetical protein ACLQ18_08820 [Streptomyces sp. DT193]
MTTPPDHPKTALLVIEVRPDNRFVLRIAAAYAADHPTTRHAG